MAEGDFYQGGITFPLDSDTTNSLLRDADPAIYFALEFFAQCIETHLGSRLVAEAAIAGATDISAAVKASMPIDPEQFLTEEHLAFPLLTLHRESTSYRYLTKRRVAISKLRLAYVLPPLRAAQAERLMPILHTVGLLVDKKCTQGRDDAYTPSGGTAGDFVWSFTKAGVAKMELKDSTVGAFQISNDLFFPAIVMSLEMWELGDVIESEHEDFEGADVGIDQREESDGTTLETVIELETQVGPSIASVSPTNGTTAGGTSVTIAGANFRVDTRPVVLFGGSAADAVMVVNSTTITCRTPPHAAYPSFAADVTVIAADGQSATLEDAFTFNQL